MEPLPLPQFSTCWKTFLSNVLLLKIFHGCFDRTDAQGLSYLHLPLWLLGDMCCADKGSLAQSVRQWGGGKEVSTMKVYQQCWKEWAGRCAQEGAPNKTISVHKLANFSFHSFRVGLAWQTIAIYHSVISAFRSLITTFKLAWNAAILLALLLQSIVLI